MTTIAMWSGPRNISTAMMYAFGNRADCTCWDEPFYAFSLVHHGNDHPMRAEIIAANDSDWASLVAKCTTPAATPHFYQKHMTHHMPKDRDLGWIHKLANAFLIRSPEKVLASYARKWSEVSLKAIGFVEQAEIFDRVAQKRGEAPAVIDGDDVLADPPRLLRALCGSLGISFDPAMLSWPAGPKPFDGVWAPHWYEAVWKSTGFARPAADGPPLALPAPLARIAEQASPYYRMMWATRLT
jgi:hypothetical protein